MKTPETIAQAAQRLIKGSRAEMEHVEHKSTTWDDPCDCHGMTPGHKQRRHQFVSVRADHIRALEQALTANPKAA